MASYDKKTKTWRAGVTLGGKQLRKRGFITKELAVLWEGKQRLNYQRGLVDLPTENYLVIHDLVVRFLAHVREYKTPGSADHDRVCLAHWLEYFDEHRIDIVERIPPQCVYDYLEWRKVQINQYGRTPARRTLNHEMKTIRRAFKWAVDRGLVQVNPFEKLPLYREPSTGLPRYLSQEEIRIIEDNAPVFIQRDSRLAHFFPAFFVLVRTGMRSGELCSLEINNIDFDRKQIILRPGQTKAKQQRVIPLGDNVLDMIEELVGDAKAAGRTNIFTTSTGARVERQHLNRRFRNVLNRLEKEGKLANTKDVHIHTLRRTYISHMIMAGADPVQVMAIVGHKEWSTIRRYLVLSTKYIDGGRGQLPY